MKGSEAALRGAFCSSPTQLVLDVSREFSPGDNLIVQNLVQGEGVQPFICECRVEMAVPLILAPMVVDDDKKLLNLGGEVRVDRVASRIVYTRQLAGENSLFMGRKGSLHLEND